MSRRREDIISDFLTHPEKMLFKKPFLRGCDSPSINDSRDGKAVCTNSRMEAKLPNVKMTIVSQERFVKELDPNCHSVIS